MIKGFIIIGSNDVLYAHESQGGEVQARQKLEYIQNNHKAYHNGPVPRCFYIFLLHQEPIIVNS